MASNSKQPANKPEAEEKPDVNVEGIKKEAGTETPAGRNKINKPKTSDVIHGVKRDRQ